jgi:hypothetical protein
MQESTLLMYVGMYFFCLAIPFTGAVFVSAFIHDGAASEGRAPPPWAKTTWRSATLLATASITTGLFLAALSLVVSTHCGDASRSCTGVQRSATNAAPASSTSVPHH